MRKAQNSKLDTVRWGVGGGGAGGVVEYKACPLEG